MAKIRRIRFDDREWHAAFFRFVLDNFRGADFSVWAQRGGWDADYEVFAALEDDEIVATIGRTRMRVVVGGVESIAWQLGAVATRGDRRGRGLARRLMQQVFDDLDFPDQLIFLFANKSVLDFYPRFGFQGVIQQRYSARVELEPAQVRAHRLDIADAEDRARLAAICARSAALSHEFSARDYYPTLLWHLCHSPLPAFWVEAYDSIVVARFENNSGEGSCLVVYDVVARAPFDLRDVLPSLISEPVGVVEVRTVEFRFNPASFWQAESLHEEREQRADVRIIRQPDLGAPLFVRGASNLPANEVHFPDLART
ncbi:MAG: GNAT family N-acetyltransferase [Dokdonella sp.]